MGAGLVNTLVQLWMRVEVGNTLGAASLGHFQAAWAISMQYIGFVLAAMGADYYPRLTGVIHDKKAATQLVNEQTEIALLLSAPVFIATIGLAPWIVQLMYSKEFLPAVEVLRWQIMGDVLKVASWPLGFVLLAAGAGKTFFLCDSFALLLMGGLVAVFSGSAGIKIAGIAFLTCYAAYLPLVYLLAKKSIGFRWQTNIRRLLLTVLLACSTVAVIAQKSQYSEIIAALVSMCFGVYAMIQLAQKTNVGGPIAKLALIGIKVINIFGKSK
jgi:PST family polysaccharide transporter